MLACDFVQVLNCGPTVYLTLMHLLIKDKESKVSLRLIKKKKMETHQTEWNFSPIV